MSNLILQKGQTALMYAIRGNHLKVSEKLILSGSDVTVKDKVHTIIHDSCTIVRNSCDSVYVTSECVNYKTMTKAAVHT